MSRHRVRFVVGIAFACGAVSACGGDERVTRQSGSTTGEVEFTFAGSVSGAAHGPAEVACFAPTEADQRFTVEIDAQDGLALPDDVFSALDVSIADYHGPGDYDFGTAVATEDVDRSDFFLLFGSDHQPYGWTSEGSAGTLTVDPGATSGRLALHGWKNDAGDRVDVSGPFRCGEHPDD